MNKLTFALALLAISKTAVAHDDEDDVDNDDGPVAVLTDSTFEAYIKNNKYVLAKFYAPWCGHCKKIAPEWEKAAAELKAKPLPGDISVTLAKVDATKEEAISKKYGVSGYPTLLWFVDGKKTEYDGGRTADTIIEWITDAVTDAVKVVNEAPAPNKRPVVILTGPKKTDAFDDLANSNRKAASFYYIKSSEKAKVTLQHPGEDVFETTSVDSETALTNFFNAHSFPLFGILDGDTYSKYTSRGQGLVWLLFSSDDSDNHKKVVDANREMGIALGKSLSGKYSVFHTDVHEFAKPIESMLGVTEFPAVAVNLKGSDKKKFIYKGVITQEKVEKFIKDIESGKIQPDLKSEPVPDNSNNNVRVVVGTTMEKEIFHADKDVLFEVYAPWCGHCKKLEPEYEKVAKKLKKDGLGDNVILAKMDGTTNDSPLDSITWNGFPTLFWIKAGSNEAVPYDGGRDAKGIWKFLKNNASNKEDFAAKKDSAAKEEL
jgi:protein disulfide isomerase